MEQNLQKMVDISEEPYKWLKEWKQANNKKLIACYPMHVPEEMIHAAGVLPFTIQRTDERIFHAPAYIQPFLCDFSRSTFDLILRREVDVADGIVFADACYVSRGLSGMIDIKHPYFWRYGVFMVTPLGQDTTREYVLDELARFRSNLERWTNSKITDAALKKSIKIYNENRALIRKVYDLRRANPGILKAREVLAIVKSSMIMPKEEHTELLASLLPQLEKRKTRAKSQVKLLVSGVMCETAPVALLDLIEDLNGVIVDDDLYVGYRYVARDSKSAANPLESLTDKYMNMVPCPTRWDPKWDYGQYIVDAARKAKVEAVGIMVVLHCEPHLYAYTGLKHSLDGAGIPHFYLELDQESLGLGKVRTNVEGFLESVVERR